MPPKKRAQTTPAGRADKRSKQSSPSHLGTSSLESVPVKSEPVAIKEEEPSCAQPADPIVAVSGTQQTPPMFWCSDCGREAAEECGDRRHALTSLRMHRAGQAAPTLQRLQDAAASARQVVQALQDARDAVEAQLQAWRCRLRQLEEAEQQLWAAAEQGGEAPQVEAVLQQQQQLHEAAGLLADSAPLSLRVEAAGRWKANVHLEAAMRSVLHPLLLQLHQDGSIVKVYRPDERKDVSELCREEEICQELEDLLQDAGLGKVRRLDGVLCGKRPNWCQALLQRVAPHVEWLWVHKALRRHFAVIQDMPALHYLYIHATKSGSGMADAPDLPLQLVDLWLVNVSRQHLLSVQHMPNLRKLALRWSARPLEVTFPPLPASCRGLQWLWVALRPAATVLSLAKAHAATLQELRIMCASEEDSAWHFEDLAEGLRQCGLAALRRVVLLRGDAPGYPNMKLPHSYESCKKQKDAIWDELVVINAKRQAFRVLCGECDECPVYPRLGNFVWIAD